MATGLGRSREEIGRRRGLEGILGACWRSWSMWNWEGRGKRVGVVVRSSGRGEEEEEGGVDIKRREMEKGGGEAENRGGEEVSLLIILTSTT